MLDVSGSDSTAGGVEWGGEVSFAGLCFLCCGDLRKIMLEFYCLRIVNDCMFIIYPHGN